MSSLRLDRLRWLILLLALSVRAIAAITSVGFEHPNESFRLLEPLVSLAGYSAHLPWEWTQGLLSELPVRMHLPIFWVTEAWGAGPISQIVWMKLLYGLGSIIVVIASMRIAGQMVAESKRHFAQIAAGFLAAAWPEMVFHSVRLMDYSLESILLAATLLAWIDRRWLLAGALIGSAFFVRFQTGLHYLSLSLTLLLIPGLKSKDWIRLTLGYGAVIFVGALTETWMTQKTGSAFLSPFINYVRYNVVEGGAARDYGSDPWHRYISEWIKFWGWLGAPALLVCGFRLLTENFNLPLKKATLLLALMPIIAHSMIAHKEGRFLVGSIWLVIPIAAAGFASIRAPKVRWIIGAIFIFAALISGSRVQRRWMHHASDVRELSTLGKSISPTVTTIQISADPNLDPVGFYLRTRAHFCHPDTVNSCAGMPKIRIGTRGWELVP